MRKISISGGGKVPKLSGAQRKLSFANWKKKGGVFRQPGEGGERAFASGGGGERGGHRQRGEKKSWVEVGEGRS